MRNFLPGESVVVLTPDRKVGYTGTFIGYAEEGKKVAIKPNDKTLDDVMYASRADVMRQAQYLATEVRHGPYQVTEEERELASVINKIHEIIDGVREPRHDEWTEEMVPPETDDPDDIVQGAILKGHNLPEGTQAGCTLWMGNNGYRISVSKLDI